MAGNNNPLFVKQGSLAWGAPLTAADTTKDGTSLTATNLIETANVEGSYIMGIRFKSRGANVATLARVFLNNGLTNATAINNTLWDEISLPATSLSEVAPQPTLYMPLNTILPALPQAHRIYWTIATAVAGGWQATVVSGDY